ncbi:MAG: hypothetical protein JF588_09085 [Caulobacterales bacterium]|nr:hypothetical protein [Caulobacterales bacterium]
MIRYLVAAALLLPLAACSQGGQKPAAGDLNAELQPQMLAWRTALEANHVACKTKVDGKGCESFEVTCKAAQDISPEEKAKGVTAQVIAAMTFNGRTADGSSGKPGSAFAQFTKTGDSWTRTEAKPVNMSTCAPL